MSLWFWRTVYYLLMGYFTYLMILISLQYIPVNFNVAFLRIKQTEIALVHYQFTFFTHVYCSIFVLILSILQFSTYLRNRFKRLHILLGRINVFIILLLAGPSGLIMSYYANGGLSSKIGFFLLSILWMVFTYKAYSAARNKNWKKHHKFMLRSFALTLSAISLRLFKWILVSTLALPPIDTYRIVSWMGWIVNLIVIELIIYGKEQKSSI